MLNICTTQQGYNFPKYRDPDKPWILMTYESANSLRQRAYYKVHTEVPKARSFIDAIASLLLPRSVRLSALFCMLYRRANVECP